MSFYSGGGIREEAAAGQRTQIHCWRSQKNGLDRAIYFSLERTGAMFSEHERRRDLLWLLRRWERRYVMRFEGEIQAALETEALSRSQARALLDGLKTLRRLLYQSGRLRAVPPNPLTPPAPSVRSTRRAPHDQTR